MSHGIGRITGCVSVMAIGGVLYTGIDDRLVSQSAPAPQPAVSTAQQSMLQPEQAKVLLAALDQAEANGFAPNAFGQNQIHQMIEARDAATRQQGEARLMRAVADYAEAQRGSRVKDFPEIWAVRPAPYDGMQALQFAVANNRVDQFAQQIAPPFQRYRDLQTALAQYRQIQANGGWTRIPEGKPLEPGMSDPRVVALRQRIAAENAPGVMDVTSPVYDDALETIVKNVQARYGQPADGVVGKGTIEALNRPVDARIDQILANMERWRWMPRGWPATRIEVNIASQALVAYRDNKPVEAMRVAVGLPSKKTPMLTSEISTIVLNPPWNVPQSITSRELAPKGEAYLARNGYQWVSNGAGGSRLQQRPGPGNALGRIKFDFKNPFAVYLHDTNAKSAFERDIRAVSHGCVRVERPHDLAELLLQGNPEWTPSKIDATIQDANTVHARVNDRWPVMLLYWTVFTDQNGAVNFYDDIYDWDTDLVKKIQSDRISA